ncbi:hypothetical protein [Haloferula sp. BvORR071]|uniref:hypothetical protein n=1 Tax=Haloferula sp. BvORR071 TaxID=1396141 RepID=UPI0005594B2D|nr:hypothetical protein [Haloferula sp. BvORR071]
MKTSLACVAFGLALLTRVMALAGDLSEPGIAFPSDFSKPAQLRIMEALKHPDCKFLGGRFVNSFTSLNYAGETKALNLFMEQLAKCPGVVLAVRFKAEGFAEGCDWMIAHEAGDPCKLTVHVNLKSSRVKLEDLVIPEVKGPPVEPEK